MKHGFALHGFFWNQNQRISRPCCTFFFRKKNYQLIYTYLEKITFTITNWISSHLFSSEKTSLTFDTFTFQYVLGTLQKNIVSIFPLKKKLLTISNWKSFPLFCKRKNLSSQSTFSLLWLSSIQKPFTLKVRFCQKRCFCHIFKQMNILFSWTWKFEFCWLKIA